jgi:hypothetical protein
MPSEILPFNSEPRDFSTARMKLPSRLTPDRSTTS